tara:strand:+ start:9938 stop:10309 length:372 start_codon:yes stop_codon:yes gene_type:complete
MVMTNINKLSHIQPQVVRKHQNVPKEVVQAAEAMEEQFANHLINEMRKSVGKESKSSAEDFYNSLMDRERAKMLAKSDTGLGIKDVVIDEYMRKTARPSSYGQFEKVEMYEKQKPNSQKGETL